VIARLSHPRLEPNPALVRQADQRALADQQGQTVKEEDRQNEELLELSRQILDLTKAIHAETPSRPAA
jgi:hypothetical protein